MLQKVLARWQDKKVLYSQTAGNHMAWAHYSTYALPLFEAAATEWLIKELGCNVSFASNVQVRHSSVRCAVWCAASSATAIEIYGMNIFEMNLIASYWVMNHVLIILIISTQVAVSLSLSYTSCIFSGQYGRHAFGRQLLAWIFRISKSPNSNELRLKTGGSR